VLFRSVGVAELEKPEYVPCCYLQRQYEQKGCCSIYAHRPGTCKGYNCLYSAGILQGGKRNRPDKLGIILDLRRDGDERTIQAWEVWAGALEQPRVQELLEDLAAGFTILQHRAEG